MSNQSSNWSLWVLKFEEPTDLQPPPRYWLACWQLSWLASSEKYIKSGWVADHTVDGSEVWRSPPGMYKKPVVGGLHSYSLTARPWRMMQKEDYFPCKKPLFSARVWYVWGSFEGTKISLESWWREPRKEPGSLTFYEILVVWQGSLSWFIVIPIKLCSKIPYVP